MTPKYLRELRRKMVKAFDEGELRTIAFDLGIEWGELPGEINSEKAAAMISHQMRKGRLEDLIIILKEERPESDWPAEIPEPEQQIEAEEANISEAERRAIFDNLIDKIGPLANGVIQIRSLVEANIRYLNTSQTGVLVRLLAAANLVSYVKLESISLKNEDLSGAAMTGADLSRADLSGADLVNTNLGRAVLDEADLRGAKLSGTKLFGATLIGANLSRANLSRADLSKADLTGADLIEANLNGAYLVVADLVDTNLNGAVLDGADLRWAKLLGTKLVGANLSGVNLSGADMVGAVLRGAKLSGANLGGTTLNWTHLSGAEYDKETTWPDGFNPEEHGLILIE